jgi:uroporphyrinogen-III decarboxylase
MTHPMTPRERLLTTLRGQIPDRVPVAPFVQDEYLHVAFPDKQSVDRVADATALAEELDFDLMAKHRAFETPHFLRKSYPGWQVHQQSRTARGIRHTRTEISVPGRVLIHEEAAPEAGVASAGVHASVEKYLLAEEDDLKAFLEHVPELDHESAGLMAATADGWREIIGDRGVLAPWGWAGVYNAACQLRGIETLMLDPYDNEELFRGFMERITALMEDYNGRLAATSLDCVGIQGHMANSRTVSPGYYRSFIQQYEKRVIDAIHRGGAFTVFHNCGFASTLYDIYRELGMTVWETVSEPPQGDNSLAEVKQRLGGDLVLLGNLDQIHFLKTASPAEVEAKTRSIIEVGKPGGRYIFSTSDFLEKGTPRENVVAMLRAARESFY